MILKPPLLFRCFNNKRGKVSVKKSLIPFVPLFEVLTSAFLWFSNKLWYGIFLAVSSTFSLRRSPESLTVKCFSFLIKFAPLDVKSLAIYDFNDGEMCGWKGEETDLGHRFKSPSIRASGGLKCIGLAYSINLGRSGSSESLGNSASLALLQQQKGYLSSFLHLKFGLRLQVSNRTFRLILIILLSDVSLIRFMLPFGSITDGFQSLSLPSVFRHFWSVVVYSAAPVRI